MKENNMSLADAMKFVKSRRSIVQPNSGFWKQLIIYEGILKSRYVLGYSTAIFEKTSVIQYVKLKCLIISLGRRKKMNSSCSDFLRFALNQVPRFELS